MLQKLDRLLPWPYTFLGLGSLCAVVSLVLQTQEITGAALPLFGAAALLIVVGVAGLAMHLHKGKRDESGTSPADRELHVYKTYPFELGQAILDRFDEKDNELKDVLKVHPDVDWAAHARHAEEAAAKRGASDWPGAVKARCLAIQVLAATFNQERGRGEEFRPNWDNPKGNS